jgi:hypothetical protein
MSFDLLSQLLGSKKGHEANEAIDGTLNSLIGHEVTEVEKEALNAELTNLGITTLTVGGILAWANALAVKEVSASSLSAEAKALLLAALTYLSNELNTLAAAELNTAV